MFRKLVPLLGLAGASAHAAMSLPPPRTMHGKPIDCYNKSSGEVCNAGCSHSSCLWYQVGCMVGCDECSLEGKGMYPTPHDVQCKRGGAPVPKGDTPFPIPRTLPAAARTWNTANKSSMGDYTAYKPWSSPGASPIADPCGVASGFNADSPYANPPPGYKAGDRGSQVLKPSLNRTVVRAGGVLEAGFGFEVNHGGGFSYRLCPADQQLDEACFAATPLAFATDTHTIEWVDGSRPPITIPAMTVTDGVTPAGSQWRRVPLPACNCDLGEECWWSAAKNGTKGNSLRAYEQQPGADKSSPRCPTGTQFPVPAPDLYGYGDVPAVLIKDQLKIPATLNGDYVLSWRWDCEQTDQIWSTCADITVTA